LIYCSICVLVAYTYMHQLYWLFHILFDAFVQGQDAGSKVIGGDQSVSLQHAARLMGVSPQQLEHCLTVALLGNPGGTGSSAFSVCSRSWQLHFQMFYERADLCSLCKYAVAVAVCSSCYLTRAAAATLSALCLPSLTKSRTSAVAARSQLIQCCSCKCTHSHSLLHWNRLQSLVRHSCTDLSMSTLHRHCESLCILLPLLL
jgi:hypothetical protein